MVEDNQLVGKKSIHHKWRKWQLRNPCFTLHCSFEALPWLKAVISAISYEWTNLLSEILQLPMLRNKQSQKKRIAMPVLPPQNFHLGLAGTTKADVGSFIWKRTAEVAVGVRRTAEVKTDPRTSRGMKDPSHLLSPLSAEPEGPGDNQVPQ